MQRRRRLAIEDLPEPVQELTSEEAETTNGGKGADRSASSAPPGSGAEPTTSSPSPSPGDPPGGC